MISGKRTNRRAGFSERCDRCGMGGARALDPRCGSRRSAAQDRHALCDERDAVSAADRLPWRYLPRDGFPPRSTVYNIFRKFHADGTWSAIWDQLYPMLRDREGREASPSAGIIDSQTIKSAKNVWPAPSASGFSVSGLICLHKRIRPSGEPFAKMESRASWSSYKGRHRVPFSAKGSRTPVDSLAISSSPPTDIEGRRSSASTDPVSGRQSGSFVSVPVSQ